jgi:hypothetical protein
MIGSAKPIMGVTLAIAGACALCSLALIPLGQSSAMLQFLPGLAMGTAAGAICILIMARAIRKVMAGGGRMAAQSGYFVRLILYVAAMFIAVKLFGLAGVIGAGVGLLAFIAGVQIGGRKVVKKIKEEESKGGAEWK